MAGAMPSDKVAQRLQKALDEEPVGMAIANHVVVNDDLDRTVDEMVEIIARPSPRTAAASAR